MCRVFLTNLKGAVLHWYTRLSRNSIDSFSTLVTCFEAQYVTSRSHHLTLVAFTKIQQEENKPFHNFMKRFCSISIWIWDLSPDVTLTSMIFSNNICKKPPTALDELRARYSSIWTCYKFDIHSGRRKSQNLIYYISQVLKILSQVGWTKNIKPKIHKWRDTTLWLLDSKRILPNSSFNILLKRITRESTCYQILIV